MSSQGNNINLLKQLPFYGKTIKPRVKESIKAKLGESRCLSIN